MMPATSAQNHFFFAESPAGDSPVDNFSQLSMADPKRTTLHYTPYKKGIVKRRIRNRFGPDPSYMGFTKTFVINKATGRANQLLRCLRCNIKTSKMCNMIDHIKTHQ